jgi:ribosomal protein L17
MYTDNLPAWSRVCTSAATYQKIKLKIQDVTAYRGPNCGIDHKLLVAKILFPYIHTTTDKHKEKKENMETMVDKNRKYNIESLQNESTKFLYQQRLTNKLNQNEFADMEEMYSYIRKCIHEAAKKALGEKEVNKGRKTMFCDAEIEKERQNKKQLFLNGLVQRTIMIKYNTKRYKQK